MKYLLVKNDGSLEVKEQESRLELKTMYSWIGNGCRFIDIKESAIVTSIKNNLLLIFDDEFLLNTENPEPNKIASLLFGYGYKTSECLCGNVIIAKGVGDSTEGFTDEELDNVIITCNLMKMYAQTIRFKVQEPCFGFVPVEI